ncbi:ATP-dependent zinc metalloprotease YME1L [Penaeus vannamei]|uniref:ATP-dependent zinc metalloprotease YME1L n=1 Tax=Penaeus vannamei TaxID=6689 RepID=UPI000F660775|nr:ATP-dependent zinc metalloprotease YME1 homolog [Penaeus vannamei]
MFSTSSNLLQNQVVLPLSYIISQYSGKCGPRQHNKNTQKSINNSSSVVNIVCSESLAETVEHLGESGLKQISKLITPQLLQDFSLYGPKLNLPFSISQSTAHRALSSASRLSVGKRGAWHESHISANTFSENKGNGKALSTFCGDVRLKPIFAVTERLLLSKPLHQAVLTQQRGFKTQQSIERESLRQTTVADRLRDGLKSRQRSSRNIQQEAESNAKLKGMLTEESSSEVRKNMKVAFAEGYLAAEPQKQQSRTMRWIRNFQQVLAIVVFIAILFSLMGGMGGSMFRMHVGNGNEVHPEEIIVSFKDVRGVEEAKQELQEIVEFLRNPEKFTSLGAELPKGVLLVGPPGTGKTLLARAVAGEAGVPFFHAAGPEFDEILVGQGARRVRDLFRAAKMRTPCVIFIDEIDSVGAKRSNSVLHPYANQTINQLLSEMDGFHKNDGVIVLGATNRRDDLDKALMRPGRFDVEVQVPIPDLAGRKEIFDYYLGKIKVGNDVDVNVLSRGTTGFTGADIKNVTNQAALRAAADQVDSVSMKHLEAARDKVLMGPEKKSRIPDEEANLVTAYHEGGHALVAHYTKDSHPLHKVTIIPRGPSLGHTAYIPAKEQYHMTRSQMLATMDSLMGGRAAEELIFGTDFITSGASSDLKQATSIATHMVKDLGMSDRVGLRTFEDNSGQLISTGDSLGQSTKESIDHEIKKLLQDSYERAKSILKAHAKEHKALAESLMKYETLDADDIKAILDGRPVAKDL